MTKLIKRKGLLFLMAIAVMVAMMSVACKNKSTGVSLSVAVDEPAVVNPSEVLTPDKTIAINKDAGPKQYAGNYFESKTYRSEDGSAFKYTVEIKDLQDGRGGIALIFTGKENPKQYLFPGFLKGRGDNYYTYNEGGSGVLNNGKDASDTVKVKFYNDTDGTWADVKPSDYNFTIKLALKNK